jgi:hypothetical protein
MIENAMSAAENQAHTGAFESMICPPATTQAQPEGEGKGGVASQPTFLKISHSRPRWEQDVSMNVESFAPGGHLEAPPRENLDRLAAPARMPQFPRWSRFNRTYDRALIVLKQRGGFCSAMPFLGLSSAKAVRRPGKKTAPVLELTGARRLDDTGTGAQWLH